MKMVLPFGVSTTLFRIVLYVGRSVQVNAGLMIRIYQVADDQGILRIRVKLYAAIRAVVDLVVAKRHTG